MYIQNIIAYIPAPIITHISGPDDYILILITKEMQSF